MKRLFEVRYLQGLYSHYDKKKYKRLQALSHGYKNLLKDIIKQQGVNLRDRIETEKISRFYRI